MQILCKNTYLRIKTLHCSCWFKKFCFEKKKYQGAKLPLILSCFCKLFDYSLFFLKDWSAIRHLHCKWCTIDVPYCSILIKCIIHMPFWLNLLRERDFVSVWKYVSQIIVINNHGHSIKPTNWIVNTKISSTGACYLRLFVCSKRSHCISYWRCLCCLIVIRPTISHRQLTIIHATHLSLDFSNVCVFFVPFFIIYKASICAQTHL